jgi:hypothetical protein
MGAREFTDRMLTMVPRDRDSAGRNAWVIAYVP